MPGRINRLLKFLMLPPEFFTVIKTCPGFIRCAAVQSEPRRIQGGWIFLFPLDDNTISLNYLQ